LRSKMREVISIHVGQAGVQIGNACCKFSKRLPQDGSVFAKWLENDAFFLRFYKFHCPCSFR